MAELTDLLTIEEVSALTRRKPTALYTERHRGIGIGALGVAVGRRILWRRADIDAWFSAQLEAQREAVGA